MMQMGNQMLNLERKQILTFHFKSAKLLRSTINKIRQPNEIVQGTSMQWVEFLKYNRLYFGFW